MNNYNHKPNFSNTKYFHIFIALIILVIVALNLFSKNNELSISSHIYASIITILGLIPSFISIKNDNLRAPFLPIFGLGYIAIYSLPVFFLENYFVSGNFISPEYVQDALFLAAVGLFVLLVSYYKFPGKKIGKYCPRFSTYWNYQKAKVLSIFLFTCGMVVNYAAMMTHVPVIFNQIVLFMGSLATIAIGILFVLQVKGYLKKSEKLLLWLLFFPLLFFIQLGTGSLFNVVKLILFMVLIYSSFKNKIPWKFIILGLGVFIVFSSLKDEFRQITWGEMQYTNPIKKGILFSEMIFNAGSNYSDKIVIDTVQQIVFNRLADILLFAYVIEKTPDSVPYWWGKTYATLLWTPFPRIFFPWKPQKTLGQTFGHRYDILQYDDTVTSVNLPQLVEMYVNFGVCGIIMGMFIIGIIYRCIYEVFCHPNSGEGGLFVGAYIFAGIINIESDFSLVFGGIIYTMLFLYVINSLIRSKQVLR